MKPTATLFLLAGTVLLISGVLILSPDDTSSIEPLSPIDLASEDGQSQGALGTDREPGGHANGEPSELRSPASSGIGNATFAQTNEPVPVPSISHYPSGQKASEGLLLGGTRTGAWREWHENGQLSSKGEYGPEGFRVGSWEWWTDEGRVQARGAYDEQGKRHGEWVDTDLLAHNPYPEIFHYDHGVPRTD